MYTKQTSSRFKKVKNETFNVIADINVVQKNIYHGDLYFCCLFYCSICQFYNGQKLWFVMGFVILAIYFRLQNSFLLLILI